MVTDGVIVRLDPVRLWPKVERCDGGPPAVKVAPPGSDDLVGGGKALCRLGICSL